MIDALQSECKKRGNGLDIKWLEGLRKKLCLNLKEKKLASGYSYWETKNGKEKRVLKLATVGDRFFIEFNKIFDLINISNIMILNKEDRDRLHAGGVEFCYYGEDILVAEELIKKITCIPNDNKCNQKVDLVTKNNQGCLGIFIFLFAFCIIVGEAGFFLCIK